MGRVQQASKGKIKEKHTVFYIVKVEGISVYASKIFPISQVFPTHAWLRALNQELTNYYG
jgi:hypothetical protein